MAVGGDLAHPKLLGKRTGPVKFINCHIDKLYRAGHPDTRAARAFLDVANLVAPPPALFAPATVARVLRAHLGRAAGPRRPAAARPA